MAIVTDASASPLQLVISAVPFRLGQSGLHVAVQSGDSTGMRLLGGSPEGAEWLDSAARRIVREQIGLKEQYLEQLYTFGHATARARTVTVSYLALFRGNPDVNRTVGNISWVTAHDIALPSEVDRQVLNYAVMRLQAKLGYTNIAFHLLPATFTLSDLQLAYEAILDHPVDKRNFRRRMLASGILDQIDEKRRDGNHRPAALYRFATRDDQAAYLTPLWAAERFDTGVELPTGRQDQP